MRFYVVAALALFGSFEVSAATVVKCVDAKGKVTFVQNQCPDGLDGELHEVKDNPRPSGDGPSVRMADPSKTFIKKEPKRVRRVVPVQPEQPQVAEQEPAPRGGVVRQNANQPCVRWVEKRVGSTMVTKDGRRRGRSQVVKVPVPCR